MPQPDESRSEPKTMAPGRAARRAHRGKVVVDAHGAHVHVARVGPVGTVLTVLISAILLAAMLVLLAGTVVIWLPLVVLFGAGLIVAGIVRTFFKDV